MIGCVPTTSCSQSSSCFRTSRLVLAAPMHSLFLFLQRAGLPRVLACAAVPPARVAPAGFCGQLVVRMPVGHRVGSSGVWVCQRREVEPPTAGTCCAANGSRNINHSAWVFPTSAYLFFEGFFLPPPPSTHGNKKKMNDEKYHLPMPRGPFVKNAKWPPLALAPLDDAADPPTRGCAAPTTGPCPWQSKNPPRLGGIPPVRNRLRPVHRPSVPRGKLAFCPRAGVL